MSSGAGERGPTDSPGRGDDPAPENSKSVSQPAQPSGSTSHSDNSSANIVGSLQFRSVAVGTTSAPPHTDTSPLVYSTELSGEPQDDLSDGAGATSTLTPPETNPTSSSSQRPSHAPTQSHNVQALTPELHRAQGPASESQETVIRPHREQSTTLHERAVQTTPSLSYSRQPPRGVLTTADSGQSSSRIRLQPEPSLTRYPQLRPASQEGQAISDSEVDPDPDARRSYYRRNQPLPPLPGRMASYGQRPPSPVIGSQYYDPTRQLSAASVGPGLAGVGSFNGGGIGNLAGPSGRGGPAPLSFSAHGQETLSHIRDATSSAPILGTTTGHTTLDRSGSRTLKSTIDWLAPGAEEKQARERTLGERLDPTLERARTEKTKFASKAKIMGWSLNIAIGLQVVIGALTTGLAAATTGRQTSIMTAILGGFATIVASFLARARGSREPELSVSRVKDLEQFIRECETFQMDFGLLRGSMYPGLDTRLEEFRKRFEELLGNVSGDRRLSQPA